MINNTNPNLFHTHQEDVIWNNPKPITTDYFRVSMYIYGNSGSADYLKAARIRTIILIHVRHLDVYAFLMDIDGLRMNMDKLMKISFKSVDKAYYFPFFGNKINKDLNNIGYHDIPLSPFNEEPQYALTEAFSGCAVIVTKELLSNTFRVWHFQSPNSNLKETERFIKKYYSNIYDYVCYSDYGAPPGSPEYNAGNGTANIYLFYDRKNGIWSIKCIPSRTIQYLNDPELIEWGAGIYEPSTYKDRFAREIDFSKPLYNPRKIKKRLLIIW